MPPKNIKLGVGTITLTDQNGKEFELGEVTETEWICEQNNSKTKIINKGDTTEISFTLKMSFRSKLRMKWQLFKAKRKAKKLVKLLCIKDGVHEFTVNLKK